MGVIKEGFKTKAREIPAREGKLNHRSLATATSPEE